MRATPAHSVSLCRCNLPQARATPHFMVDNATAPAHDRLVEWICSLLCFAGVQAQPQVLIRVCVEPESHQVTFTSEYVSLGSQLPLRGCARSPIAGGTMTARYTLYTCRRTSTRCHRAAGLASIAGRLGTRRPRRLPALSEGQGPCLAAREHSAAAAACACSTSSWER